MSGDRPSARTLAAKAWGEPLPDWIEALADQVETTGSQGQVARQIGYTGSVVSQVLRKTYPGNMDRVEAKVRGAILGETVSCPVVGSLSKDQCLDYQKQPFAATNSFRIRIYRACRDGCPFSRLGGQHAE